MRSMHKVMRFVHGLRYWLAGLGCWVCLGSLLAGFFARVCPPIAYAVRLLGLCVGFVWACWVLCVGGCLPWVLFAYLVRIQGYALFA
jgi:hypothetical protein